MAQKPLPYREPDELVAGESASWLLNLPYYLPSDGWTVEYGFVSAAQRSVTLQGTDNGDGTHRFDLTTTITSAWAADLYFYQAFATNGTERVKVREGRLTVTPDLTAQAAAYDARSDTKAILDQIVALLKGRTVRDVDSYTINGRSLVKMKPEELIKLKQFYEAEYAKELREEKIKRGARVGGTIRTRFNAMSRPAGFGRMRGR